MDDTVHVGVLVDVDLKPGDEGRRDPCRSAEQQERGRDMGAAEGQHARCPSLAGMADKREGFAGEGEPVEV